MTGLRVGWDRRRGLLLVAIAVLIVAAAIAFVINGSPGLCNQTMVCVRRVDGGVCLPGPCDAARHRAVVRATESVTVAVLISGFLLAVGHRR